MAIDLEPSFRQSPGRRRGLAWLLAGPRWAARRSGEATASGEVVQGSRLIEDLAAALRGRRASSPDLVLDAGGRIDVAASAVALGLSEQELGRRLGRRRRQTALLAWGAFAAGFVFLAAWVVQALAVSGEGRVWAAFQFLPFCVVFFLLAFRSAWQNWQLRAGRVGSVSAFLRTADRFWPSAG